MTTRLTGGLAALALTLVAVVGCEGVQDDRRSNCNEAGVCDPGGGAGGRNVGSGQGGAGGGSGGDETCDLACETVGDCVQAGACPPDEDSEAAGEACEAACGVDFEALDVLGAEDCETAVAAAGLTCEGEPDAAP